MIVDEDARALYLCDEPDGTSLIVAVASALVAGAVVATALVRRLLG